MSLTAQSPQSTLAWGFDGTTSDSVTGLAPSSSLQPGPGYLQGSAALVTNAPTSNTAVYFPGTAGSYMSLGANTPTNFNTNSSNLFVEAWVRAISTANPTRIYGRGASITSTASYDFTFRFNAGSLGVANGTTTVSAPGTVTFGVWYHCALSITTTGLTTVFLNGQAGIPTIITVPYRSTYDTYIGAMTNQYTNGYIRDLRVVQGGIVPTANFTPEAAPFTYDLPGCVTGSGTTVFTLLSQFFPYYVPGKYKQALYFDNRNATASASNSYTTYTLTSGTSNSYSLSCWIMPLHAIPPSSLNPNYVVLRDTGGYYSIQNFAGSSTGGFYANEGVTGGQGTTFSGLLTTGKWDHHCFVLSNVDATSSNTIVNYYFNGTSLASGNVQRTNGFSAFSAFDIAYRSGSGNSGAWCSIDDLRLFNTALTPAQVRVIYASQGMPRQGVYVNTIGTNKTTLSGTPLFSQLSSEATSSAVGAFSLRAINGTTAKAVQVTQYALLEVPPVGLTQNTFTATGTFNGVTNGQYVALCSSYSPSSDAYRVFDKNIGTRGLTAGTNYTVGTGVFIGSASTVDSTSATYNGGWFQIKIPSAITAVSYSVSVHSSLTLTAPYTWKLFGSTTGASGSWVVLDTQTTYVFTASPATFNIAKLSGGYTYFRLAANMISPSSTTGDLGPAEIIIYGYSSLLSTTQDFWADRLGNLLTAPVTGTTLANWLGGTTGYVSTWYDQSGKGNHATQATTANQPVIQKATKGSGYSCSFNGTSNYLTGMSYTVLRNTNYSFSFVERRNTNATSLTVISSGNASADQGFHFQYLPPGTTVRFGQYSDDMDLTSYPAYVSNEPIHYWTGTESSTSGRFLYENGTVSKSDPTKTALLSSVSGNLLIGARFVSQNYYSGEIYELVIFTQSLYDLDGTASINQIYQNQLSRYGI